MLTTGPFESIIVCRPAYTVRHTQYDRLSQQQPSFLWRHFWYQLDINSDNTVKQTQHLGVSV